MKKINHILFALIALSAFFASCNRPMTFAEHLRAEQRAIARFISENNFTILDRFPSDTIFRPNEFFKDQATGVYFNIVCRGDLSDRIALGRELYVRFRGLNYFMIPGDTLLHSNDRAHDPIEMVFRGAVTMQNRGLYDMGVPAFIVPLQHIGHNGTVRMIVPFSMGFAGDRSRFQPAFFEEVDFRFERPWMGGN